MSGSSAVTAIGGVLLALLLLGACGSPSVQESCNEIGKDDKSGPDLLGAYGSELNQVGAEVSTSGSWTGDDSEADRISARLSAIAKDAPRSIAGPLRTLVNVLREVRDIETADTGDVFGDMSVRLETLNHQLEKGVHATEELKDLCPDI
jgi:hypothetical protein